MLTPNQIASLLSLSQDAGKAVMGIYEGAGAQGAADIDWSSKSDGSPLTMADLRAHKIIVDGLAKIAPTIPVVSEEDEPSLAHCQNAETFWLIDPLDGTKEFISRNGEFTINIALIKNGVPVFGIVLAPCLDLLYWGGMAVGAFRQRDGIVEIISTRALGSPSGPMRVIASRSHMNPATVSFIDKLGPCELLQVGSSLKFCRIAEGGADIYPRMGPTSEWDTAAGHAILLAAGGRVCMLDGEALRYGKADILNPFFIASSANVDSQVYT